MSMSLGNSLPEVSDPINAIRLTPSISRANRTNRRRAADFLVDENNFAVFQIEVVRAVRPELVGLVFECRPKGLPVDR